MTKFRKITKVSKPPIRVTVALDDECYRLLEKLKITRKMSQSALIRNALKFYAEWGIYEHSDKRKLELYINLLSEKEHIILDVDHWQLFLMLLGEQLRPEDFWNAHRKIAQSHAEQLKASIRSPEKLLERLEICNFYLLSKSSDKEYTLLFGSEMAKRFVKIFLEEFFNTLGFSVKIKENLTKLRVIVGEYTYQ